MKLVIQIPCYNEEETIGLTINELPQKISGFEDVKILVIDDGSLDKTAIIAAQHGANVVRHANNKGLAQAFMTGLDAALKMGADVIVNTDADNQYNAQDIPSLVQPILEGKADMVIGTRPISEIYEFSKIKKILQKFGSWVVRIASGTTVQDAPSGFRALSRNTAMHINVFNNYTYTLESIIQAGQKNLTINSVPIRVNPETRPSRLVSNIFSYVAKSTFTIIRIFVIYKPFFFCMTISSVLTTIGALIGARFLYHYIILNSGGHIQSLILASILIGMGFQTLILAFISDTIAANRKISEEIQHKYRTMFYEKINE